MKIRLAAPLAALFALTACVTNNNEISDSGAGGVKLGASADALAKMSARMNAGADEAELGGKAGDPDLRAYLADGKVTRLNVYSVLYKTREGVTAGIKASEVESKLGKPNATKFYATGEWSGSSKDPVLCAAWSSLPGRLVCVKAPLPPQPYGAPEPQWSVFADSPVAYVGVVGRAAPAASE